MEAFVSFLGQGADAGIPGDADPFDTAQESVEYAAAQSFPPPEGYRHFVVPSPSGEVNTLATLSVVFAFVLAPVGVVLGHLALSQIKHRPQPGRRRAILGLTFSYVLIVLAVVALLVWLLLGAGRQTDAASMTDTMTPPTATPSVRSTVITPPAQGRPKVSVADLRVGDCVEIQKNEPVPTKRADKVYIYRTHCVVGDGIFVVRQIVSDGEHCPTGEYLTNEQENICACFVKYGQ